MQSKLLYLFTRTPLHVGAGSSVGAVDLPVQRERHTGYPVIPGSAIKGVVADEYLSDGIRTELGRKLLGQEQKGADPCSGSLSFGEATLLAFPVRAARGCFAWVTAPLPLERWCRATNTELTLPTLTEEEALFDSALFGKETVLEDSVFHCNGAFPLANTLANLLDDPVWKKLAPAHMVCVSDDLFAHFVTTCCPVAQHVSISDETGAAKQGALFNQENVPSETLFWSRITELRPNALAKLTLPGVLQIGADATTGLGFCTTKLAEVAA